MKKTTAIAALAVSSALLLSACGGSDVNDVEMPEPTATEETTAEANEANEANPQDDDEYTEIPQVVPVEPINEENLLPEPQAKTVAGTEVTMNLGDVLEMREFSWFTTCPFSTQQLVLDDDGNVAEIIPSVNPRDTYVLEYDSEYLELPQYEESSREIPVDADGNIDEEAALKLSEEVAEESANTPKFTGTVITLEDSGDTPFGYAIETVKTGTTELRVAYSCESTGESFDKTWIIKINP